MKPVAPELSALRQRARLCADIARRIEESAEPFESSVESQLCDLYIQSIYWSRRALAAPSETEPKPWALIQEPLLTRAVPQAEALQLAQKVADTFSFRELALYPNDQLVALTASLRSLALALLSDLDADTRSREALWTQRFIRIGAVCVLLAGAALALATVSARAEKSHDLALGKQWRTSSQYAAVSPCISPAQECRQSPDFFFHTNQEARPWLEIDLASTQTFSAVRVDNRTDCCSERAVPLVIEVSSDQKQWHTVARRDAVFSSWLAKFPPVSARYVRLRLERRDTLHLQRVRVLP